MFGKSPKLETLLAGLEGRLTSQFLTFIGDLSRARDPKFAVECLLDQLHAHAVELRPKEAMDLAALGKKLEIDDSRLLRVQALVRGKPGDAAQSLSCSLEELVAADDPIAFGAARGAGDLLIVRALREKYGLTLIEAMTRLRAGDAPG